MVWNVFIFSMLTIFVMVFLVSMICILSIIAYSELSDVIKTLLQEMRTQRKTKNIKENSEND